jgi:hypothetical protein
MSDTNHPFESLVRELEGDPRQRKMVQRLMDDYPEELTMEVVTAAMQRGHISSAEAIKLVRECNFSFRQTFGVLAVLGRQRGWQPTELVLEALEGQPH